MPLGLRFLRTLQRLPWLSMLVLPAWLSTAAPAQAALEINRNELRFFAGLPITFLVHGPLADTRILGVDAVAIAPQGENGLKVELTLRTEVYPGLIDQFAHPVSLPEVPAGRIQVVVQGIDRPSGFRTVYVDQEIAAEPALAVSLGKTELVAGESLTLRAQFVADSGFFSGSWQRSGSLLRVPLHIGCFSCPIPYPVEFFDLESGPVGPLAAGEYTVELVDPYGGMAPYFRQKIRVLPAEVSLQDGRFEVEIPLDGPHGAARLAEPPSTDSALFYFFSPDNWEVMVKVLDGCDLNGKFWVFGAASTDVGYTVVVRDLAGGGEKRYRHEAGTPAPAIADTAAFDCAVPAGSPAKGAAATAAAATGAGR